MKPRTLQLLIDLEQRRLDQAQTAFAQMQSAYQQAVLQTRQLEGYRADYQARSPVMQSLPTLTLKLNQQDQFLQRLTEALNSQRLKQDELAGHLQHAQAELAHHFQRVHGLKKLQVLEHKRGIRQEARLEQLQLDERASHRHFHSHQALT